jgi:hypothetical protein
MKAQYVTCLEGHKMYVCWVEEKQRFAFTCEECHILTPSAQTIEGVIELTLHQGATLGRRVS